MLHDISIAYDMLETSFVHEILSSFCHCGHRWCIADVHIRLFTVPLMNGKSVKIRKWQLWKGAGKKQVKDIMNYTWGMKIKIPGLSLAHHVSGSIHLKQHMCNVEDFFNIRLCIFKRSLIVVALSWIWNMLSRSRSSSQMSETVDQGGGHLAADATVNWYMCVSTHKWCFRLIQTCISLSGGWSRRLRMS